MNQLPQNLRYTKEHEWARAEDDGTIVIGITRHAVDALGDITMVSLPESGDEFSEGDSFGDIDSVKAVSELYCPVTGKVVAINENLEDAPEAVNDAPYDAGWMVRLKPTSPDAFSALMSPGDYEKYLEDLTD